MILSVFMIVELKIIDPTKLKKISIENQKMRYSPLVFGRGTVFLRVLIIPYAYYLPDHDQFSFQMPTIHAREFR